MLGKKLTLSVDECQRPQGHLISVAALEISTDLLLLALASFLSLQVGTDRLKWKSAIILAVFVFATVCFAQNQFYPFKYTYIRPQISITITNRVLAVADDDYTIFTWNVRECALAITTVCLAGLIPYWRNWENSKSTNDMNNLGKTSTWRRSWRPISRQKSKDVMEIASGNILWKDVAPKNMASRDLPRQSIRNSNQPVAEGYDIRAESPVDRLHMGTISSMSTSSWLNIDGD